MKKFKDILIVLSFFLSVCFLLSKCGTEDFEVKGTVLSHNTTSDKFGNIEYYTIVQLDNGNLVNKSGMSYYIIPVGHRVSWVDQRFTFNW